MSKQNGHIHSDTKIRYLLKYVPAVFAVVRTQKKFVRISHYSSIKCYNTYVSLRRNSLNVKQFGTDLKKTETSQILNSRGNQGGLVWDTPTGDLNFPPNSFVGMKL